MKGIPQIPYFQTSRYRIKTMVALAEVNQEENGVDLGTGDGRIAIAFAKAGVYMTAYEIDDKLKQLALSNAAKEKVKINFEHKDFWQEDLSKFNIICCYPMPSIMRRLERKLKEEVKPDTRILLNYFPFLHWKEEEVKDNIYLYRK